MKERENLIQKKTQWFDNEDEDDEELDPMKTSNLGNDSFVMLELKAKCKPDKIKYDLSSRVKLMLSKRSTFEIGFTAVDLMQIKTGVRFTYTSNF